MKARALPPAPHNSRTERLRLQREREALAKRRNARRLHRILREQSEALRDGRARLEDCPDLHELVRVSKASAQRRVTFAGCTFIVHHGAVFSKVCTVNGRHLASFGGAIFDV